MWSIKKLEHVTVLVRDLDESIRFYTEVLGLRNGPRPPFSFPGAWLYVDDVAVIHLVAGRPFDGEATGAFDHIGLVATDPGALLERCERAGVPTREREVPGLGLQQIFVEDPNGVSIELNFPLEGSA
jgi:catechol 2,3-dioxygenase-like lactoylglutathione lyase family enzyme